MHSLLWFLGRACGRGGGDARDAVCHGIVGAGGHGRTDRGALPAVARLSCLHALFAGLLTPGRKKRLLVAIGTAAVAFPPAPPCWRQTGNARGRLRSFQSLLLLCAELCDTVASTARRTAGASGGRIGYTGG